MLTLTHASLATVAQLFEYKSRGLPLEPFPGYTPDQWGIKAHNRPWIEAAGDFRSGQRVIEVGGAYSSFPRYLANKHGLEAWIGDDFGRGSGEEMWSRWGDPAELPARYPRQKYVFERFGEYSKSYPDAYFDRIFSVSTLEHIPQEARLDVLKDMNRCLRPGGMALHSIDVGTNWRRVLLGAAVDAIPGVRDWRWRRQSEIRHWIGLFRASGVRIAATIPNSLRLLDRATLVESPDVVYRFYPPNDAPKRYQPGASLLVVIQDL